MADELNIKVNAKLDIDSSTKQINADLQQIAKNISVVPVSIKLDTDSIKNQTSQIQAQLNNTVNNASKGVSLDKVFNFDSKNMTQLYSQLDTYKAKLNELSNTAQAQWKIITNSKGNVTGANLSYYDDAAKAMVTENYKVTTTTNEANESIKRMALSTTTYSQNAYKAQQQLQSFNAKLAEFKTTVNSFGDKNISSLLDNNQLGTKYQSILNGLNSVSDSNGLTQVKNQFKELQTQTSQYANEQKVLQDETKTSYNTQIQELETLTKSEAQRAQAIQETSNKVALLAQQTQLLESKATNAGVNLNQTKLSGLTDSLNNGDIEKATQYYKELKIEYQQLNAEMSKKLPQNAIDNMQERAKSLSTQIDQITAKFSTLNTTGTSNFTKNFSTQIEQANTSIKELQTNLNTFNTAKTGQEQVSAFNQLNNSVKESKTQVNDLVKAYQTLNRIEASAGSFEKYLQQNPQVLQKHLSEVKSLQNQYKQLFQETDITKLQTGFKEVNTSVSAFKGEIRSLGEEGRTVFGELGNDLKKQLQWLTSGSLLFGTIAGIKDMYSEIVKLDDQMVELRKVTDESEATYSKFYNTANETAKSLGATTESVIGATAAWAQMGYNLPDSTELAKDSEIFKNISENMTVDEATNSLISTLKAFKISSGDALDGVISKVNEVGNRFAVTNKDIAEGLERSASSMAVANNSMDQTIALLTAATEVTRDADSAGTALKTEFCLYVQKCAQ